MFEPQTTNVPQKYYMLEEPQKTGMVLFQILLNVLANYSLSGWRLNRVLKLLFTKCCVAIAHFWPISPLRFASHPFTLTLRQFSTVRCAESIELMGTSFDETGPGVEPTSCKIRHGARISGVKSTH